MPIKEAKQEIYILNFRTGRQSKESKILVDIIYEWSLVRSGVDGQPAVAGVGVVEVDEGGDHGVPLEGEVAVVLVHRERGAGPGGLQVRLGVMLGGNSTDFI